MYLYNKKNNRLNEVKEKPFKLEKDMQKICEENLHQLFGLELVKSEFSIENFRFDTLAFDKEKNSFVIIEYKNTKKFSIIDQGYSYLAKMLNNKSDFILEYNEQCKDTLKRGDVDWSQSRIIFVSPGFTMYQKESINFKDLPMELWEIRQFENELVSINQVKASRTEASIKTLDNNEVNNISKEIKVYTEEDNLAQSSVITKELYEKLRDYVLELNDNITLKFTKLYVAFLYDKQNIVDITVQKSALKLWINMKKGELNDPLGIMEDVKDRGHWGNGDYGVKIENDENLEYIVGLIKQSLKKRV